MRRQRWWVAGCTWVVAFGALELGKAAEPAKTSAPAKIPNTERYENLGLFQKVLYFVEQNYVEEVKERDLIYGAIKGMMDTLDPHSNFLPPEVFKEMKTDTSGKFGGVGIELALKNNQLTVVSPIDDTPAFRAGLKAGDKILRIDGETTKGLSLSQSILKMRGKRGTEINLSVWREGFDKPRDYKLVRDEIKIRTVKVESLEPRYLYVRLTNFNEHSTEDVRRAIQTHEKDGQKLQGLVLDLRNNPGGLLEQAVSVTSLFLDEGVVVSTMGRTKEKEIQNAKKGMARKDFPMAVLVNGASASASEIVAGALQDHKRAVVMGQPTFGKGSVQSVVEIQPEIGLKLTIAKYYTPSGRSIQLKGIQPDLVLDELDQKALDEATRKSSFLREKDLKHHMNAEESGSTEEVAELSEDSAKKEKKSDDPAPVLAKNDYQVRQALNYIKGFQIFRAATIQHVPDAMPEAGVKTAADTGRSKE